MQVTDDNAGLALVQGKEEVKIGRKKPQVALWLGEVPSRSLEGPTMKAVPPTENVASA